jgi:hypothetical protein
VVKLAWSMTVLGLMAGRVWALDVTHATTYFKDKVFYVDLDVIVAAPPDRVMAVLLDYTNYPRLDGSILESKVQSREASGALNLYTKLRACSGLFCRTVNRVERVQESPSELLAVVLPEQSDVIAGRTHTVLQAVERGTRVRYQSELTPNFWVPGLIGRPLMLRTLKETSLNLFRNVEIRAHATP